MPILATIPIYFHSWSGIGGQVFSFEPEPKNFEILERNSFPNTTIEEKAVSDKNGSTELYLSDESDGLHSIVSEKSGDSINVETVSLDSYLSDFERKVDIVKIDVEGAERSVLDVMEHRLSSDKPNLVIEYTHYLPSNSAPLKRLSGLGYSFYTIGEMGKTYRSSLQELIEVAEKEEKICPETFFALVGIFRIEHFYRN